MKEAAVVIGFAAEPIYWHLPNDRTVVSLPDSQSLWDVIWQNRYSIQGIAHSHPGTGRPRPSMVDLTTFSAIERGIGRKLFWWITSEDRMIVCFWEGPGKHDYRVCPISDEPEWSNQLREKSSYNQEKEDE